MEISIDMGCETGQSAELHFFVTVSSDLEHTMSAFHGVFGAMLLWRMVALLENMLSSVFGFLSTLL